MTSQGRSTLTVIVVVAAAVASFALVAAQGSRASAQAEVAKAREAKAKAQEAAAALAKDAVAKAQAKAAAALKEAEAKAAQARAAAAAKGEPVALDLTKFLVMKPEQFEKIKSYPWAVTPVGKHTFAGVPLEIQGATILWGKRNADRGQMYPETVIAIPVQQKFETLYILHCVFFEAAKGEPSFDIVLNYEGGETQTDTILNGEDSKDWWVNDPNEVLGPTGKRSTLAWKGTGKANGRDQDVRFCLTAIDNKHPERLVTTIDLVSSKKQAAGVILAITLGKAGLLKPEDPADKPAEKAAEKPAAPSAPKVKLPASP
jgi:hypothetical protein